MVVNLTNEDKSHRETIEDVNIQLWMHTEGAIMLYYFITSGTYIPCKLKN